MAAALGHDQALYGVSTPRAGFTGAAKHLEFIGIASLASSYGVKISLAGSQGCSHVFETPSKDKADGFVQTSNILCAK
jgi:hypothetical protein